MNFAQRLFEAYNETEPNPWKTFDGRPVPQWEELSDQVRGKWEGVARVAAKACGYSISEVEEANE